MVTGWVEAVVLATFGISLAAAAYTLSAVACLWHEYRRQAMLARAREAARDAAVRVVISALKRTHDTGKWRDREAI